jgi:hypothetical protein
MKRCLKLCGVGVFFSAAMLVLAASVSADISVVQQVKLGGNVGPESYTRMLQVKGLKMRVEARKGSETYITIYDLEAGTRYRLDAKRKEAFVADLGSESEDWQEGLLMKNMRREIKATGKKVEINGIACDEYTFDLQVPTRPYHLKQMLAHDGGTACVSQAVPNGNEFTNFVHEAQKRGYLRAAAACSPTYSAIGAYFYGDEPNAVVLSSDAKSASVYGPLPLSNGLMFTTWTLKILSIQQDPLPEDIFQIPTDWKVKKEQRRVR